jgi:3-hydroxyisobutyrate dehydrogenase-like beta-hydroxyacid dehydrogenase
LAKELGENGVEMLDAPVSGGVLKARKGMLSVMVGGDREIFEQCKEILSAFGERVTYVGESGAGHLVKSLNNMLSATTLVSAAEAMASRRKPSWRS